MESFRIFGREAYHQRIEDKEVTISVTFKKTKIEKSATRARWRDSHCGIVKP